MTNIDIATILITIPKKKNDPTQWTAGWAEKAVKIANNLGYNVIPIRGNDVNYDNVVKAIKEHKPRMFVHWGHGCPLSLQGQNECVVNKNMSLDGLFNMATCPNQNTRLELLKILNPLGPLSCPGICNLDNDPCAPLCNFDTNVDLLKGTIVFAVACYSASKLGEYAVKHGADCYVGYADLMMFPTDTKNSQAMFGEVQLTFFENILLGKTVAEAEREMSELEDGYIRKYKQTKYISLPFLWNKLKRKVLGNSQAMIYE